MRDFPLFGKNVFTQAAMRDYMRSETYDSFMIALSSGKPLDGELANLVADAMMNWACDNGATHFTHWFQPLTGATAEKHEAFVEPLSDGTARFTLSGKALTHGEPDASAFPSGGLRAVFEARGLTTWDYSSPAFLKENVKGVTLLCIPTSFCSYNGQSLDEKTPLLRSMDAVSAQTLRVLRLLGDNDTQMVMPMVGAEQEYFLVDAGQFDKRMDLVFTGRTLFGARPTKSQEMEGHYYGTITERIAAYMRELDEELWKLGVSAKIRHNEAAPAQHELAPVYGCCNIAADHNQLIMETMQRVAVRHNLRCLLHEKPFDYMNGSGKHNNWSLAAVPMGSAGIYSGTLPPGSRNLIEPGDSEQSKTLFLALVAALLAAVDKHAGLLRSVCANLANDLRLGGFEAPPAVLSVSLGAPLTDAFEALVKTGRVDLPSSLTNQSDRNRTSPLAYTGNRFEFRMLSSSVSVSFANVVLNTIMADELRMLADKMTVASKNADVQCAPLQVLASLTAELYENHKRVVYNGNGYDDNWLCEAERRGLKNLKDTVDALPEMLSEENAAMFDRHNVLTKEELEARNAIKWEAYIHDAYLEASTMLEIVDKQIFPACMRYQGELARDAQAVLQCSAMSCQAETVANLTLLLVRVKEAFAHLKSVMEDGKRKRGNDETAARYYRDNLLPAMRELRAGCDALERITPDTNWPFPTYNELLFNI